MKISTTSKEELSPYGDFAWLYETENLSRRSDVDVEYDDSWNIEAEYEGIAVEASSTGPALFSFHVTSVSETTVLTRELPSSTSAPDSQSEWLTRILLRVFSAAREEVFEHGMESVFSLSLTSFIESYEALAIEIISGFLASGNLDKAVAMETLRQLGLSEHEPTYDARKQLLLKHLKSELVMIRYGSMYGLSSLDDPETIHEIELAFKLESDPYLQKYMSAALAQLRETRAGA